MFIHPTCMQDGYAPLIVAILEKYDVKVLQLLLDHKADVNHASRVEC